MILAFAWLGMCVGSFVNVCADRLPLGQSIVSPPSHCPACNHRLSPLDLVPLFSYVWLRGRCRYCRAAIPLRLPVVEGAAGLLFALLYWKIGLSWELGIILTYASLLIIVSVTDLENQIIPDKVVYPGMALALAFSFLRPGLGPVTSLEGGAVGLGVMAVPFLVYRRGMGMGDVKLGALVGLMSGYPLVLLSLWLSWTAGGLVAAVLLLRRAKKRDEPIPFGPFLAASAMVTLLWGEAIREWYFAWLQHIWTFPV